MMTDQQLVMEPILSFNSEFIARMVPNSSLHPTLTPQHNKPSMVILLYHLHQLAVVNLRTWMIKGLRLPTTCFKFPTVSLTCDEKCLRSWNEDGFIYDMTS